MRVPKYLLYLLLPVPLTLLLSHYVSSKGVSLLGSHLVRGMDEGLKRISDFELQEVKPDKRGVEMLSYVELRPKVEKTVQTEVPQERPQEPPSHKVQLVFLGRRNYAIVDGRLLREGEDLSPEERVVRITKDGVLVSGRWGKRWLRVLE